jgi:hypothetical protein
MKRSPEWFREQSRLAEREYQRVWWGARAAPVEPKRRTAAQSLYPKHPSSAQPSEIQRGPAPETISLALYPHLRQR